MLDMNFFFLDSNLTFLHSIPNNFFIDLQTVKFVMSGSYSGSMTFLFTFFNQIIIHLLRAASARGLVYNNGLLIYKHISTILYLPDETKYAVVRRRYSPEISHRDFWINNKTLLWSTAFIYGLRTYKSGRRRRVLDRQIILLLPIMRTGPSALSPGEMILLLLSSR